MTQPPLLTLAAIQMISTPRWQDNLHTAERLIAEAAQTAKLVILPEFFIQITTSEDPGRLHIAEPLGNGPIQQKLAAIARQHHIYLLAGTLLIQSANTGRFFNSAILYDPAGDQVCHYHKMHLFTYDAGDTQYDEGKTFLPGQDIVTCDVAGFRLGLSTCYDLRFPELYRAMGPVDALLLPAAFTRQTGEAHWEILCRARAIENQCYFVGVDQGGTHETGRQTYGHTLVVDPWGQLIASATVGETIIYATLDKSILHEVRTRLPALQHRRLSN